MLSISALKGHMYNVLTDDIQRTNTVRNGTPGNVTRHIPHNPPNDTLLLVVYQAMVFVLRSVK